MDDRDERVEGARPRKDEELEPTRIAGEPRALPVGDAPPSIGTYRILGRLGEGGMGVVYEAEQQDPKRIVALKVIRGGAFVDDQYVRMFEREVETLARLTHPNIGAIYESGRTEDGRHFFAMELVRGQTLDAYIASRGPTMAPEELEHRLRLFAKIASAVHYAHQRGVIHRDLKPSNIVVTSVAEEGATASAPEVPEVKILDFGLARITDEDVRAASVVTEVGVIKGTLAYMSPEQARGDTAAVDVRTDVYALGVLLHEMISGQRPYDVVQASLLEAVRVICEEPPRSLRATWSGTRRLDADVETILGKALEKDPERRYASAAAFADDVGRFLASEPILARPPSAAYQMRKFAQRHRPIVVGAGIAVLALVAGVVVSTSLYFRAERAAERARIDAATARQVGNFLQDMLAGAGPSVAQGRDVTLLREILGRASKRIDEELIEAPEIEARLRSTLGTTYAELNDFEEAERQFGRALAVYGRISGGESADVAATESNLGLLESKRGNHDAAVEHLQRAVEIARRVHGDAGATGNFLSNLGNAYSSNGKYQEALEQLEQADRERPRAGRRARAAAVPAPPGRRADPVAGPRRPRADDGGAGASQRAGRDGRPRAPARGAGEPRAGRPPRRDADGGGASRRPRAPAHRARPRPDHPPDARARRRPRGGVRRARAAADLPRVARRVDGRPWGEEATRQLLDAPEPPSAIIAGGNQLLIGALAWCAERGVEIGRRLSLVGCDDVAITELYRPQIATVRRDNRHMGRHGGGAAAAAPRGGEDDDDGPAEVVIPTEFVPRQSCVAPAAVSQA